MSLNQKKYSTRSSQMNSVRTNSEDLFGTSFFVINSNSIETRYGCDNEGEDINDNIRYKNCMNQCIYDDKNKCMCYAETCIPGY